MARGAYQQNGAARSAKLAKSRPSSRPPGPTKGRLLAPLSDVDWEVPASDDEVEQKQKKQSYRNKALSLSSPGNVGQGRKISGPPERHHPPSPNRHRPWELPSLPEQDLQAKDGRRSDTRRSPTHNTLNSASEVRTRPRRPTTAAIQQAPRPHIASRVSADQPYSGKTQSSKRPPSRGLGQYIAAKRQKHGISSTKGSGAGHRKPYHGGDGSASVEISDDATSLDSDSDSDSSSDSAATSESELGTPAAVQTTDDGEDQEGDGREDASDEDAPMREIAESPEFEEVLGRREASPEIGELEEVSRLRVRIKPEPRESSEHQIPRDIAQDRASSEGYVDANDFPELRFAEDGRSYGVIKDLKGEWTKARGCIFPEGYEVLSAYAGKYPWICPARNCRLLFTTPTVLGRHFQARHRSTVFNDNQDGTLSEIGRYDNDKKSKPPYIGSVGRPGPNVAQAVPMRVHTVARRMPRTPSPPTEDVRPASRASRAMDVQPSQLSSSRLPNDHFAGSALWDYLKPHLSLGEARRPGRALHREILGLPRQRDLPLRWQQKLRGMASSPTDTKEFTALLIYLTGALVNCSSCSRAARSRSAGLPFDLCVALPASISETLEGCPEACVCCNCLIANHARPCRFVLPQARVNAALDEVMETSVVEAKTDARQATAREASVQAQSSRSARAAMKAPERQLQPDRSRDVDDDGGLNPYTVEEWETAPGRFAVANKRAIEGSLEAFSSAYLADEVVQIAPGITTRDCTVKPGARIQLLPSAGIQICHVLRGKPLVKLPDRSFFISAGGRVVLGSSVRRDGESVTVENRFGVGDVVLSVYTVRGEA